MLPKAHLTSHSRMSGSRCVITPLWLSESRRSFLYSSFVYCYHILGRRQWHPIPVLLPGKSHGWRSLVGCSPWGHWGSETTEWLHFHHVLISSASVRSISFLSFIVPIFAWNVPLVSLNFLEEISSLSHSIVFLYIFALITEEGFISPCYFLELCIQMQSIFPFLLCLLCLLKFS